MKLYALILLASLSAFAQKIQIESDPSIDFKQFHTFTIVSGRLNSKNPNLNGELVRKRIEFDIQKFLSARKLVYSATPPADLNVRYTLGSAQRAETEAYPAGWRGWGGYRVVRVPYTEGTLVIDLRQAATRGLVWRSIAREDKGNAVKVEDKLDSMVKKSFDKYPPKN